MNNIAFFELSVVALSFVALIGAVVCFIAWLRRGRSPRALSLGVLLAATAAWLNPWSQLALDEAAQRRLCARINSHRGSTHAELVNRLEMKIEAPRKPGKMSMVTVKAQPWYAPVGIWEVNLLFNPDTTLVAAYAND